MRRLKAALRLLPCVLLTLAAFPIWLLCFPFVFWSPGLRFGLRNLIFRFWAHSLLTILRVKLTVEGTPPEPPFFLVSNHLSYLDIIVIASQLDAAFVAKSEISGWPAVGLIFRCFDTIYIDRSTRRDIPRVLCHMEQLLASGLGIVVFPEGTSTRGAELRRFLPSLLETPARAGLEVSWAAIHYKTPAGELPAHLSVCWWGDAPFLPHALELASLPRVDARVVFGEETCRSEDRKELARQLHQAVSGGFVPIVDEG